VKRVFIKRIENIRLHVNAYEARLLSKVKNKLKMMFAGLDEELCAGQVPTDFKARIDAIYQEIIGECNYAHDFP
jgi:hypothetical protein